MTDAKFGRTETLIRTPDFNSISLFAMVMQFCVMFALLQKLE